jgi:hypothetical protein
MLHQKNNNFHEFLDIVPIKISEGSATISYFPILLLLVISSIFFSISSTLADTMENENNVIVADEDSITFILSEGSCVHQFISSSTEKCRN